MVLLEKLGIHVPETAILNLYGTGTLTAIGGNASNASEMYSTGNGGSGGGGAGAGIGRKWWSWCKFWCR